MTTEQTLNEYFTALHGGDWQKFIADDFIFVVNNSARILHGKESYFKGAGDFFRATTSVEIIQRILDGNRVALIARYEVLSPKGTTGACDVAEFLTIDDGKLTTSSIFFDTKALAELMQS